MYNQKKCCECKNSGRCAFQNQNIFPATFKKSLLSRISKAPESVWGMSQEGFQLGPRTHENTLDPDAKDTGSDWEPPQKGKAAKRGRLKTSWSKKAHGKKKNPKLILGSKSLPKRRIARPPSKRVVPGKLTVAKSPFLSIFDETQTQCT